MYRATSHFVEKHRYHYDVTIYTFCFVNSHLTASNKGELDNQNAAYKIIALVYTYELVKFTVSRVVNYDSTRSGVLGFT